MQVYKFGGASIATPERMRALLPIISQAERPLLLVVSALGKTTNQLEAIVAAAAKGEVEEARTLTAALETVHRQYAQDILHGAHLQAAEEAMTLILTELEWSLDDAAHQAYDYVYDQMVCVGELLSTTIFSHYLNQEGCQNTWLDVRDIIRTNSHYRDAQVDEAFTEKAVNEKLLPLWNAQSIVITQGFIGATDENHSTTLGREGSDYTAALLGSMLNATKVTIWKDVEGLLNADPRLFDDTIKIPQISYYEVIEMAYYGAQVIHPKTIKPLHNKGIPLAVKCFLNPSLEGTLIDVNIDAAYPPIIVCKKNQVLLEVISKDYSFVTEDVLSQIYELFAKHRVKINMMQNAAISLVAAIDNRQDKIAPLINDLQIQFMVRRNEEVELLTVRHYDEAILNMLCAGKSILLQQKTRKTAQFIVR